MRDTGTARRSAAVVRSRLYAVVCAGIALLTSVVPRGAAGQRAKPERFTRADTLRGSITPERAWWDVTFYDLHVAISPSDSTIHGWNGITYRVVSPPRAEMQIDLQVPLVMDSVVQGGRRLSFRRDSNAFFVTPGGGEAVGSEQTVTAYYHGRPRVAQRPPWDGGFVWTRDSLGHPWIATADQGLGASVWWPNKDTQADEPDSQRVAITVPDSMMDVSNGRLRNTVRNGDGTTTYEWFVQDPINNYDVAVNIGAYTHLTGTYDGLKGPLTLDFWPLAYHREVAASQFKQATSMLRCFESWFGPYPWYADGYKLIEAPHLGMEHQSAVAYGNHYRNGYLGIDLSGSGWGLKWDFIIVHESAHEWWGNSLTTADVADMWVHESFANYAEALYTECLFGKDAGAEYARGSRARVLNDSPIVGHYGVNNEGSGDMYYKGGNMLHTIRQIIGNDSTWLGILRGLNSTYWHQIVTGRQIEEYISRQSGIDLAPVFDQYLRATRIPQLEYATYGGVLRYRWGNVVRGFAMPVRVALTREQSVVLVPTKRWQSIRLPKGAGDTVAVDPNYYVTTWRVDAPPRCTIVCRD